MSYAQTPKRTGVPREILKWLQSLDLSFSLRNIRRDISNGYHVAEVLSCYYPDDFSMHSYNNGTSLQSKLSNWSQIERSLMKLNIGIPKDLIDGTVHCKPGAAEILIQEIYVLLTHRRIKSLQEGAIDFTDRGYQDKLPMVARATASKAIKNNLRLSEVMAEPSIDANKQKIRTIINMHVQRRQAERVEKPQRFDIKPTLGELAVRLPPSSGHQESSSSTASSRASGQFREIEVRQTDKTVQADGF